MKPFASFLLDENEMDQDVLYTQIEPQIMLKGDF